MDSYECKIKQVLAENKQDYSEAFSEFLLHEQNLPQLSKLIVELKSRQLCCENTLNIHEPTAESKASETPEKLNEIRHGIVEIEQKNKKGLQDEVFENNHKSHSSLVLNEKISLPEHIDLDHHFQDEIKPISQDIQQNDLTEPLVDSVDVGIHVNIDDVDAIATIDAKNPTVENIDQVVDDISAPSSLEQVSSQNPAATLISDTALSAETEKNRQEIESVFRRSKYEDIKFQVENARVGQSYQSKIIIISHHDASEIRFKADSFCFPDEAFSFDEDSQTIQGEPLQSQEFEFTFQFSVAQEMRSAHCRLNVIADPRSLWKVLEPEAGQEFAKQHTDKAMIDTVDYKIIAASRRGRSHEHAGTFRDDDFSITQIEDSTWSVLCAADGAGSANYSREGSRIAAEIVRGEFRRYLTPDTIDVLNHDLEQWQVGSQRAETNEIAAKLNQQFHLVYYEIYKSIIEEIELKANQLAVNPKVFSTTLLIAVICKLKEKTFISTFSVGDGAIAVYSENNIRLMNVPDGGEYAGQTKFLDRSIAQEFNTRLKIGCFADTNAVMLMTDGISDPIFETDSGLVNHAKWQRLYAELDPLMQIESADTALLEWMHFFTPGHHDDRTMAVLWNKP